MVKKREAAPAPTPTVNARHQRIHFAREGPGPGLPAARDAEVGLVDAHRRHVLAHRSAVWEILTVILSLLTEFLRLGAKTGRMTITLISL